MTLRNRRILQTVLLGLFGLVASTLAGIYFQASEREGEQAAAKRKAAEAPRPKPVVAPSLPVSEVVLPEQAPAARRQDAGVTGAEGANPVLVNAGWGAGLFELGRERPAEGNPEGPMSFTLDGSGNPIVLDQVNGRLVRYSKDGKPLDAIPVAQQAPQDLAVSRSGSLAVLDRLAGKSVAVMSKDGKLQGELPLAGKNIDNTGAVTGVFVDGENVYVEREHGPLVKVGDTSGKPDPEQPEIPGRPTRDGLSFILANLVEPEAGRLAITSIERKSLQHRFTRELRLGETVVGLVLLDTDRSGVIYLGTLSEKVMGPNPAAPATGYVHLICLDPLQGTPIGQAQLPANETPEESFRDFAVLDGGGVVYAHRTEQGVTYQRFDCQ